MTRTAWLRTTLACFVAIPIGLALFKIVILGYRIEDVLPRTRYRVTYELTLDGHGGDVRVRTFLPVTDQRQEVVEDEDLAPLFHFETESRAANREATWVGSNVPDGATIEHTIAVLARPIRFDLDPSLVVPASYPTSIAPYLLPEEEVQVDAPEIRSELASIGADRGAIEERLARIMRRTSSLTQRPFKGTTDALTALRLGEASCNGKSRLFVAFARAAQIPARLVGGLILEPGVKRTSHQWAEAWIAGHWVPFDPTNRHFGELPEHYLALYYGDESLFVHTADVNFDYRFAVTTAAVPSPRAKEWLPSINVWSLFERLGLSWALLRTVLMLPIGALVVVLFRNVIGMPTFGTFLPALIAAAAGETGPIWGVAGVLVIVTVVGVVRWLFHRLELLHSPMLAILLAAVTTTMLGLSLASERLGLGSLPYIAIFPIAVLAITSERFYLSLSEHGLKEASKELAGTLAVTLACWVVMGSLALQALVIGFPEVLLLVVAADIYLGRWVGMRLIEYVRFRRILVAREPA